jgi:regulator of nonsense transcripts 3
MASISSSARQPGIVARPNRGGGKPPSSGQPQQKKSDPYIDLKLVIRLLPYNLTEKDFFTQLSSYYPNEIPSKYYVQGQPPKTPYDNPEFSRAYVKFRTSNEVDEFMARVRNQPFVESETNDSVIPMIEKSLYNKMPDFNKKKRGKSVLLEDDPIYKSYLRLMENNEPFKLRLLSKDILKGKRIKESKGKKSKIKEEKTKKSKKQRTDKSKDKEKSKDKPIGEAAEAPPKSKDEKKKKKPRRRKPKKDETTSNDSPKKDTVPSKPDKSDKKRDKASSKNDDKSRRTHTNKNLTIKTKRPDKSGSSQETENHSSTKTGSTGSESKNGSTD